MSQLSCGTCSRDLPDSEAYELNGRVYCETCVKTAIKEAVQSGQPTNVLRVGDKSNCARCNKYSSTLLNVGNLKLCEPCAALVQDWPYPQWLKLSLAGLFVLLVFSLVHGRKYFEAGKNLYRGEQLIEKGQYAQSLPYLTQTLQLAPDSDKGALLTAKAALLSGDVETAHKALMGHDNGHFDDAGKPEFVEVNALWDRATQALDNLDKAEKLEKQDGHEVEAAALVHQAASTYPQLPQIQMVVDYFDAGAAFSKKDYDEFLRIAEKDWILAPSALTAGGLASALACKYAVTNDLSYRARSEEMLAKAKELSAKDKEAAAIFPGYEERIKYRLKTREIMTKAQYNQRFRNGKEAGK